LRFDGKKWIERTEREEHVEISNSGRIRFHTRMFYDMDPEFDKKIQRAIILLSICGNREIAEAGFVPQTIAIPYYPLPAEVLREKMQRAGFETAILPALKGKMKNWKYDTVVGRKQQA
jgi:hypothetical protein